MVVPRNRPYTGRILKNVRDGSLSEAIYSRLFYFKSVCDSVRVSIWRTERLIKVF